MFPIFPKPPSSICFISDEHLASTTEKVSIQLRLLVSLFNVFDKKRAKNQKPASWQKNLQIKIVRFRGLEVGMAAAIDQDKGVKHRQLSVADIHLYMDHMDQSTKAIFTSDAADLTNLNTTVVKWFHEAGT